MKLLFAFLVLYSLGVKAQSDLKFDQRLLDCEDKWIAVPAGDSINYYYGFVYLDNSAGLTFNLEGTFSIDISSRYLAKKERTKMIRLGSPSKVLAAIIPNNRFSEIGVSEKPDWLALYRTDDSNVDRLFRLGSMYNAWGDTKKALTYLNKVKKIDRKYPGLNKEYYYAYNGEKRQTLTEFYLYEAIADLSAARQTNCELYKSLVFKQTNSNQLKQAEEMYYYALKECVDETAKADMAYNIAFQYYKLMNKDKLKHWENEVKRWIVPNESYVEKVQKMIATLN